MPFDGLTYVRTAVAISKLIRFFGNPANWHHEDYCRQRGQHSYTGGRFCLSGALEAVTAAGAPDVRRYVERVILRTRFRSVDAFNAGATHDELLTVLCAAEAEVLKEAVAAKEALGPPEVTGNCSRSRNELAAMRPKAVDGPPEVALLDDLISFFEKPQSRPGGPHSGVRLSQALHHFRAARGVRGDKTAAYLRRALRGVPWTFGSVKTFDTRASREQMLAALQLARDVALEEAGKREPAAKREPLKIAA
jgi:hypothetical protein